MSQQCPPGTISYQMKAGDTLYRLAQRFGTTVAALISANPTVKPDQLQVGQRICVPRQQHLIPPGTPNGTTTFTCPPSSTPYIIQPGDTYFKLAQRFNTTIEALTRANPTINPYALLIGERICIPGTKPVTTPTTSTSKETASEEVITTKRNPPSNTDNQPKVLEQDLKTTSEDSKAQKENDASTPEDIKTGNTNTKEYRNSDYQVRFYYPVNWRRIYDERYEGTDGFFQISAYAGNTLEEVCQNEAHHVLNPYGSEPDIRQLKVGHQSACLILPSEDQPKEMANQAALIIHYQVPIQITNHVYSFFVLWSSTYHIQSIIDSLEFLSVKPRDNYDY